jgi:hypothetical protein
VATVVHEQFNAYENMRSRGELREGIPLMDAELRRRGFYTDGVKEAVTIGWDRHTTAEKHYSESFLESSPNYKRSDLTTSSSLKLYSSFFSPDKAMTTTDLTFLLGEKPIDIEARTKPGHVPVANRTSNFVTRAARLGIPITSHSELMKSQPLFQFERRKAVPAGFEMINEDMFARKDNKFMVLNGAGVDSWHGTAPITKISGIESMLLGTLG